MIVKASVFGWSREGGGMVFQDDRLLWVLYREHQEQQQQQLGQGDLGRMLSGRSPDIYESQKREQLLCLLSL